MKRSPQYFPIFAVVAAGIAVLVYALWPQPVLVDIGQVTRGALQVTVNEDGKTRVKERYIVSAPLSGRLSRIELHAGDEVTEKTRLAAIQPTDPSLLDPRLEAEAEARVNAAEAWEQSASARLEAARQAHELARDHFKRAQNLLGTKAIPKAEFDEAEHQEKMAAETFRAAQFDLRVAKFELELAQAALIRTRPQDDTSQAPPQLEIYSPVSGQVLRVMQESAAVVSPGLPLLEVGNLDDLEVEIDVLSSDAARIVPGAKVLLENWGGETLHGTVRRVEPSGFTKVSALGVEEQRVNVLADFNESRGQLGKLGDAYRVEARIVVWESPDVLKIPAGALFRKENEWAVFTVNQGRAQLRTVRIGENDGREAEVLDGLAAGEEVVLYPSDDVTTGVAVRVR